MNCGAAENLIWRDLDGEASDADRWELLAHMQVCSACRALRATASVMHEDLRATLAVDRFVTSRGSYRESQPDHERSPRVLRLWKPVLAAATVLAIAGLARVWLRNEAPVPGAMRVAEVPAGNAPRVGEPTAAFPPGQVQELPGGRGRIALSPEGRVFEADDWGFRLEAGACYLEVTPGFGPFEVRAGGVRVQVLGTSFGVAMLPGGVAVGVNEGRVLVGTGLEQRVVLPGQEFLARLDGTLTETRREGSGMSAVSADPGGAWSWKPEGFGEPVKPDRPVESAPVREPRASQPSPQIPSGGGDLPPVIERR